MLRSLCERRESTGKDGGTVLDFTLLTLPSTGSTLRARFLAAEDPQGIFKWRGRGEGQGSGKGKGREVEQYRYPGT